MSCSPRVAVPHQRAEEHFPEQRIADVFGHDLTRRETERVLVQLVVVRQPLLEPPKSVDLAGKLGGHLRLQQLDAVAEPQFNRRETDRRADLRRQGKILPLESQLPQHAVQRAAFGSFGSEVGQRVQSDVVVAAPEPIERIQPANRIVAFENADALVEVGQANAGSQPRHACANDQRIVHRLLTAGPFPSESPPQCRIAFTVFPWSHQRPFVSPLRRKRRGGIGTGGCGCTAGRYPALFIRLACTALVTWDSRPVLMFAELASWVNQIDGYNAHFQLL